MKRNITQLLIAVLVLLGTSVWAQGTESRSIQPFSRIQVASLFDVHYTYAPERSCTLEGDQKLLKNTQLEVKDETLCISLLNEECAPGCNVRVAVFLKGPEFKGASVSGLASLILEGAFPKSEIDLSVADVATFQGMINASVLKGSFSGVADVKLSGTADKAEVSVCGTVDLKARELMATECIINVSGVATAKISVTEKLEAFATGLSKLTYWGNPTTVSKTVTELSEINQRS